MKAMVMNQNGAPTNGTESITTRGGAMMSLNAVVVRTPLSNEMSSMVIRHLSNHLSTWCASIPEATFRINTIGDLIYLDTNSVELLDLYKQYEEPYVAYLVEYDTLITEEWELSWPEQAA